MAEQYLAYFSPAFWFIRGDQNPMHLPPGQGLVPWAIAPLVIAGLFWLAYSAVKNPSSALRRVSLLLLIMLVLYPVPGAFTIPNPHVLRAVHVLPLVALLTGIGTGVVIEYLVNTPRMRSGLRNALAASLLVVLLACAVEVAGRYESYFTGYSGEVAEEFHYGMPDALAYVEAIEGDYDEVWIRHQNSAYIYLLFYRRWDPSDVHRGLVVRRNPPDWNVVESIGRYRFGDPPGFVAQEVLLVTNEPAGRPAYGVVKGLSGDRAILVIQDFRQELPEGLSVRSSKR
jgi:hypothetical protein